MITEQSLALEARVETVWVDGDGISKASEKVGESWLCKITFVILEYACYYSRASCALRESMKLIESDCGSISSRGGWWSQCSIVVLHWAAVLTGQL